MNDRRDEITQSVNRNGYDHDDSDTIHSPNGHHRADFYNHVDENAKKWPPGYWETYETLREEARDLCGFRNANVVALLNGYFEVRFHNKLGQEFSGPQCSDRLDALKRFIADGGALRPTAATN